tara:strand:- start:1268 stop:1948 length:681 start_codon:yes stop_codon:yes gene_type:complete
MVNPNRFYTYAYLREDRTPYYIGKGSRNRIYENQGRPCDKPKNKSRIIFLKQNLTEEEAFNHEIYMISVFGRIDIGTGILRNKSNGGEGKIGYVTSDETKNKISKKMKGRVFSAEWRKKISEAQKGEKNHNYGKPHTEETKRKISISNKGNKHSDESKLKIGINNSQSWKITFENGNIIEICGAVKWSMENGYHHTAISMIASGKRKKHKDIVAVEKMPHKSSHKL